MERKDNYLQMRMSSTLLKKLKRQAEKEKTTVTDIVFKAIEAKYPGMIK